MYASVTPSATQWSTWSAHSIRAFASMVRCATDLMPEPTTVSEPAGRLTSSATAAVALRFPRRLSNVPRPIRLTFDTRELPFAEAAADALGVARLEDLAGAELARKRSADATAVLDKDDNFRLSRLLAALPGEHPL